MANSQFISYGHGVPITTPIQVPHNFTSFNNVELNSIQNINDNNQLSHSNGEISQNFQEEDNQPVIDIVINNVVCCFSCRCHLNLKKIAMEGSNVIFRRSNAMVNMRIRNPCTTANIWSSGKITCTGSTSAEQAKIAARKFCRTLQNLGFKVHFTNFRIVNVLGTCSLPFNIRISEFSKCHQENASYEPELHPGVTYKIKKPKATLKIFSTGSITVTAPAIENIEHAITEIYPLVLPHRMEKTTTDKVPTQNVRHYPLVHNYVNGTGKEDDDNSENLGSEYDSDDELPNFDSDESQD